MTLLLKAACCGMNVLRSTIGLGTSCRSKNKQTSNGPWNDRPEASFLLFALSRDNVYAFYIRPIMEKRHVVLVVEDEPLLLMFAETVVEDAGFEPLLAENADKAIAILESRDDIRIVFTDSICRAQ